MPCISLSAGAQRGAPVHWRAIYSCAAALTLLLGACAAPSVTPQGAAHTLGFVAVTLEGAPFRHAAFARAGTGPALHVYLPGDGRPTLRNGRVAADPGPHDTLIFDLAAQDPAPVLVLGRPCQYGQAGAPPCDARWWTQWRYAPAVVDSLARALAAYRQDHADAGVVLVGHSGGGTLAMLLAARVPGVRAVVTVAGNLDVGAWTALHGYSALEGLDPARAPPLPAHIRQLHLAGGRDREVPAHLIGPVVARQTHARLEVVPAAGHRRGWAQIWPRVTARLDGNVGMTPPDKPVR